MRVPKPVFLIKRFAAAVLIVAVTLVAATPAPAAEGPALAPAEYKPLPVGTRINYDNRIYVVSRIDGFSTVYKNGYWRKAFVAERSRLIRRIQR